MSKQLAPNTTPGAQLAPQQQLTIEFPALAAGEVQFLAVVNGDGSVTHSILMPEEKPLPWEKALAWAQEKGGDLPTRIEQSVLWAKHRGLFQRDYYWSNEQHAADSSYAWLQSFSNGYQYYWHQDTKLMARAVRRVTIRQFRIAPLAAQPTAGESVAA